MQMNIYHVAFNKLKIHTLASFVLICLCSYMPSFMRQTPESNHFKNKNQNQPPNKKKTHNLSFENSGLNYLGNVLYS